MPTVTLTEIQARQSELAGLIAQFQSQAPTTIEIEEDSIELDDGEHYAGAVLDEFGAHQYHLVLMAAKPPGYLAWQPVLEWAEQVGGALPTRQEQALLFANCKPHLLPRWHWSCEAHETEASYAWDCDFNNGRQYDTRKSYEGGAVAVRRV